MASMPHWLWQYMFYIAEPHAGGIINCNAIPEQPVIPANNIALTMGDFIFIALKIRTN